MSFRLISVGRALPADLVSSVELDKRLGKRPGWLEAGCGVRSRYVVGSETQISLGLEAARHALAAGDPAGREPDLALSASGIAYQTLPSTAPVYQHELGIADGRAASFDVNSTCLSFLTALDIASALAPVISTVLSGRLPRLARNGNPAVSVNRQSRWFLVREIGLHRLIRRLVSIQIQNEGSTKTGQLMFIFSVT